jgi:hypothetical protein
MDKLPLILAAVDQLWLWYLLPLVIVVSLVYAATRHEQPALIFRHALRIGVWIVGFMVVVFLVLVLMSWWV